MIFEVSNKNPEQHKQPAKVLLSLTTKSVTKAAPCENPPKKIFYVVPKIFSSSYINWLIKF